MVGLGGTGSPRAAVIIYRPLQSLLRSRNFFAAPEDRVPRPRRDKWQQDTRKKSLIVCPKRDEVIWKWGAPHHQKYAKISRRAIERS